MRKASRRAAGPSRRDVLTAGVVLGTVTAAEAVPAAARTIRGEMPWAPGEAAAPTPAQPGGYVFFAPDESAFVEAAVARLIPADELGPGAREAGVPTFIDRQLAGPYGRAERWYMQGPWKPGTEAQGYQSRLNPAQYYRASIRAVDAHCRKAFNKAFAELAPGEQDKVLTALEKGEVALEGVDAKTFFDTLWQNTLEGFFADPLYGGNRDMAAWKMIGFPGARYDYRDFVGKHGQRYPLPPVGIMGRPDWSSKS